MDIPSLEPKITKAPNHIYEHADTAIVIGLGHTKPGNPKIVIQLARDIAEAKEDATASTIELDLKRLVFATVTMDAQTAKDLIRDITKTLEPHQGKASEG